ncbi:MAG: hypothetical protein K8J08_01035 [Thermoanaerobaculia bacterium]|nr:hypothetical protein [Thermoanaerobaculia bacterium]
MFQRRDSPFGEAERGAIRRAVEAAEGGTSAEVVPYVVDSCDDYRGAEWMAALGAALAAALGSGAVHALGGFWGGSGLVWITLPVVVAAALGQLVARLSPSLRRWLVPRSLIDTRVSQRAKLAFLEEEIFSTRDRTGILIFLALFERRAIVLADEGINSVVASSEWEAIVAEICRRLRADEPVEGLVGAIEACGLLLHERRVERRPDDADELSNELRAPGDQSDG